MLFGYLKSPVNNRNASDTYGVPITYGCDATINEIKETSKKVFRLLNLSGVCRIDYLIDKKKKKIYVNEPNTIPGSLAFYLWEPIGKTYTELLDDMINIAIKDYKSRTSKIHSFESNILQNFNGLKGSKGKLKF